MNVGDDLITYLLDPQKLLSDLKTLSDEDAFKLVRVFLGRAEMHDRRLSSVPSNENEQSYASDNPDSIVPKFDKAKTLDNYAVAVATHLKFNVNIFAGVHSDFHIVLSHRLYRRLLYTILEGNSEDATIEGATVYDLGTWDSLEPTLAYAALVYHLWIVQVIQGDYVICPPMRDDTPNVFGLSEVPMMVLSQSLRQVYDMVYERCEQSFSRLHDLYLRLVDLDTREDEAPPPDAEGDSFAGVKVARPTVRSFLGLCAPADGKEEQEEEEVLPPRRLLAAVSFALGRMALQRNLVENAGQLMAVAKRSMAAAKLEYIEEAGATTLLVENYLTCCQEQTEQHASVPMSLSAFPPPTAHWHLVDAFYRALLQLLDSPTDPDFSGLLGPSSLSLPPKANLRGSAAASSKKCRFSPDELVSALESDFAGPSSAIQIGFALRMDLERLLRQALLILSRRAYRVGKSPKREITQAKKLLPEWQAFYTRVAVCNGAKWIIQSAAAQYGAFCDLLIGRKGEEGKDGVDDDKAEKEGVDLDPGLAVETLMKLLERLVEGRTRLEVVNFLGDFLFRVELAFAGTEVVTPRALSFVEAIANSSALMNHLPQNYLEMIRRLQDRFSPSSPEEDILAGLPDVTKPLDGTQFAPLISSSTQGVPPLDLLVSSPNPHVVAQACDDLLASGTPIESILVAGAWQRHVLPILINWITPAHLIAKQQQRDTQTPSLLPPALYDFLGTVNENPPCLPALVLLLRAFEYRCGSCPDYDRAKAFRIASSRVLPPPPTNGNSRVPPDNLGAATVPLWRKASLHRWICGVLEHEAIVVDLLVALNQPEHQAEDKEETEREVKLGESCKSILTNAMGPNAVISDDLVVCSACFLLLKDPDFVSNLPAGGPQMLELITRLLKFSSKAEVEACIQQIAGLLQPSSPEDPTYTGQFGPSRKPRGYPAGNTGSPPSVACCNTKPLKFLVQVLSMANEKHRVVLDNLVSSLARCLMAVEPLFQTDEMPQSVATTPTPQLLKDTNAPVVKLALMEVLQCALGRGLASDPQNVRWLRLLADLHMPSQTVYDVRTVISLLLQVAAVSTDSFTRPLPTKIFNERIVGALFERLKLLGRVGDAVVMCQLCVNEGGASPKLVAAGVEMVEAMACYSSPKEPLMTPVAPPPSLFDALDVLAVFIWDTSILEALIRLQKLNNNSAAKLAAFQRCMSQAEINVKNTETLPMTRDRKTLEFLRYLSSHMLLPLSVPSV